MNKDYLKPGFLLLIKGEIKEEVDDFNICTNHPLDPLLHKEGEQS